MVASASEDEHSLSDRSSVDETSQSDSDHSDQETAPVVQPMRSLNKLPEVKPAVEQSKKAKTTGEMILQALAELNERNGLSLQAIKKYLSDNFGVNTEKTGWAIRKYLVKSVSDGVLVRTKGKGASGSFRLSAKAKNGASKVKKTKKKAKAKATPKLKSAKSKASASAKSNDHQSSGDDDDSDEVDDDDDIREMSKSKPKLAAKAVKAPQPKKIAATKQSAPAKAKKPLLIAEDRMNGSAKKPAAVAPAPGKRVRESTFIFSRELELIYVLCYILLFFFFISCKQKTWRRRSYRSR